MAGTRVRIEDFAGMIPRRSDRLLPPTFAAEAQNCRLYSGEIRALRGPAAIQDLSADSAVKAYRLPNSAAVGGVTWVGLDSRDTSIFRGPLLNDTHERYYMFGDGYPQYNTLARIENGDAWYRLGIPTPSSNITVGESGGTGDEEERFYVYTLVSAYGEEGPPCDPAQETGNVDGTWALAAMDTTVSNPTERNITKKRIYRTVPGYSSAEFFFVAEIDLATATYNDTEDSDVIARNNILESEQWFEPPQDIEGAVIMPNGFFLAWTERDLYFSESYRPHAWPPAYGQSTEFNVLAAGVFGVSAAVATDGNPYIATGVNPNSVTLTKTNTVEPCVSKHSLVSFPDTVLYASQNGLVSVSNAGVSLVSRQLLTKPVWESDYSPNTIWAAQYEEEYLAFHSPDAGFILNPVERNATFVELDRFAGVDYVQTDPFTGDVFLMISGVVYLWDDQAHAREQYLWRSKVFEFPKPCNLGAAVVSAGPIFEDPAITLADIIAWNMARYTAGPLDTFGSGGAIGEAKTVTLSSPYDTRPQIKGPIGGSPLLSELNENAITLTVYADGEMKYSEILDTEALHTRLPSGFKARRWQFEVNGRRSIFSIKAAETGKGLEDA